MADNTPESNAQDGKQGWVSWFIGKRLRKFYNKRWGERYGKVSIIGRSGRPEQEVVAEEYSKLFDRNDTMTAYLLYIEKRWTAVENKLFGIDFHFEKEPRADNISDSYRTLEYFRNEEITHLEANIFKQSGTVNVTTKDLPLTGAEIKEMAKKFQIMYKELKEKKDKADRNEGEKLSDIENTAMQQVYELLTVPQKAEEYIRDLTIGILPNIEINEINLPFLDGKPEKIIGIGSSRLVEISEKFDTVGKRIDHFSSTHKIGADVRAELNALFRDAKEGLKDINTIENEHAEKLESIYATLVRLNSDAQNFIEDYRPEKNLIRFAHTYKIIKPFRVVEGHSHSGTVYDVKKFKDEYINFPSTRFRKWDDELEIGLDENGWPLELQKVNNIHDLIPVQSGDDGVWIVLTDRWWLEISQNRWHIETILGKSGGKQILRNKVTNGIKRYGIRTVPEEYVGDVEPLEKISFISNETDAFRDDFRDGRWHPHSKSIMDYLIASTKGIIPTKPINFDIDTTNLSTRIRFVPIYYTKGESKYDLKRKGELNPNGGLGDTDMIPDDERRVSRRYELETEIKVDSLDPEQDKKPKTLLNQVRIPNHLNPAFDRAALNHEFIHWGRMLYYEPTEGINKWSENPFPHITTRGIAKYLIDLTLRKTFSFSEARQILKGHTWDYGVRHYADPDLTESAFTTDPLGPSEGVGGALYHAREIARKKGGGR